MRWCRGQLPGIVADMPHREMLDLGTDELCVEVGQLVAKPDSSDGGRRYKHTQFAQLVAGSNLTVRRKLDGIFLYRLLHKGSAPQRGR